MIGWVAATGAAALGVLGLRSWQSHQPPHTAVGSGISDLGTSVARFAGHTAGSAGRWASDVGELAVTVTGSAVATGAGSLVDAVASPFGGKSAEPTARAKAPERPAG
jgi:hypothetical protein